MRPGMRRSLLSFVVLAAAAATVPSPVAAAAKEPILYQMQAEHKATQARLEALTQMTGPVAAAAQRALAVIRPHDQREEEFVLPLLSLVDDLVDGKVTPDMAWAIPMSDKVIAERGKLYDEHTAIIAALNELGTAAQASGDANLLAFTQEVAGDEVNDGAFVYPTAILVGKLVREKLAK